MINSLLQNFLEPEVERHVVSFEKDVQCATFPTVLGFFSHRAKLDKEGKRHSSVCVFKAIICPVLQEAREKRSKA